MPSQEIGLGEKSPKWPILCWVGCKTTTQSLAWLVFRTGGIVRRCRWSSAETASVRRRRRSLQSRQRTTMNEWLTISCHGDAMLPVTATHLTVFASVMLTTTLMPVIIDSSNFGLHEFSLSWDAMYCCRHLVACTSQKCFNLRACMEYFLKFWPSHTYNS